jgi:glycosyltransferase involved in cell wall biosynthesis
MNKVLLVSSANPYPVVTNGCEKLVLDYQRKVFAESDVHFVATKPGTWEPRAWYQGQMPEPCFDLDGLLQVGFDYAFFVGFRLNDFTQQLTACIPSFCLTDTHPHPDVADHLFRGILSHRVTSPREDVLLCGGSYDGDVFYPNRGTEEFVLSVGRIHPDKNQLELVREYRDRIFLRCGLPLYLVGGVDDRCYYENLRPFVDQVSVRLTIDPERPDADDNWLSAYEIAALLNRSRFFVTASPKESFGIALVEALACGTTCVLNGDFWGFDPAELQPRVFGNVDGKRGSILDMLEQAITADARRDGSDWVKQYSTRQAAVRQLEFIERRLRVD